MKVLYISLCVVIADQITKFAVKGIRIPWLGVNIQGMLYGASKPFIGNFVKITFIENPGMAFGVDVVPQMLLRVFTIIASVLIFYYIYKHRKNGKLIRISLAFILAGAVGNLIDRLFYGMIYNYAPIFYGKVVDFVQVDFWHVTIFGRTYTSWPIFNVADVSVTVGFLIILFFHKKVFQHKEKVPILASDSGKIEDIPEFNQQDTISENNSLSKIKVEDRTSNPDPDSAGSKKAQD